MTILKDIKLRVLDLISNSHYIALTINKIFVKSIIAKKQVSNFVFSQKIAVITFTHNKT